MLSDKCFDFLDTVRDAARELAEGAEYYGDSFWPYDRQMIDELRQACAKTQTDQIDVEAIIRLVRLTYNTLCTLDAPPMESVNDRRLDSHIPAQLNHTHGRTALPMHHQSGARRRRLVHSLSGLSRGCVGRTR